MSKLLTLATVASLLAAGQAFAADPAPVIAAERAFAARAAVAGVATSFLEFMTDEAIVFAPDPVKAKAVYGAQAPGKAPKDGGTLVAWWPNFAGLARSGDLGFTTGPATVNGKPGVFYFTVWTRQADGRWKWVYDGGVAADSTGAPGPDGPVMALPASSGAITSAATAMAQVRKAEAALATAAAHDVAAAYAPVLAPDARVQGSPAAPATTPQAVRRELATRARAIDFAPLGGSASGAGDLAWTYGDARWAEGRGHYVRIWQRRGPGWRIVFDQIIAVAPPPKPASTP